jgi:hypothetical protein
VDFAPGDDQSHSAKLLAYADTMNVTAVAEPDVCDLVNEVATWRFAVKRCDQIVKSQRSRS